MNRQSPQFSKELLADFWLVTVPFLRSSAKRKAWGALAILSAPLFLVSGVNVLTSYINRDLMSALAERKNESVYYELALYYAAFILATRIGNDLRLREYFCATRSWCFSMRQPVLSMKRMNLSCVGRGRSGVQRS